jgi:hypothetical protein
MTAKISAPRRARKSSGVRSIFGQCAAAAVGAGLAAISMSAFGADPAVGYSRTVAASPHSAPTGRRPIPARPIDPQDREPNRLVQRAALVDQLYDDLMRSSGCMLASSKASTVRGC